MKKRRTAPKRPMQHHKETILHKMKVPEGEERKRKKEKYLKKKMHEHSQILMKDTNICIQESQQSQVGSLQREPYLKT